MQRIISNQKFIVFCLFFIFLFWLMSSFAVAGENGDNKNDVMSSNGILDGKKFVGPTGEKGKKAHHKDVLSFDNGMFTSSACIPYGFKEAPYTTSIKGDTILFQAKTTSPKHGKIVWEGTINGNALDATYNWIKKRWLWTISMEYWFKGTLVK